MRTAEIGIAKPASADALPCGNAHCGSCSVSRVEKCFDSDLSCRCPKPRKTPFRKHSLVDGREFFVQFSSQPGNRFV